MDKLKSSIEEANLAVDKEREKNVSLLHMIFPPNIAKRLWLGKYMYFNLLFFHSSVVRITSYLLTCTLDLRNIFTILNFKYIQLAPKHYSIIPSWKSTFRW